MIDWLMSFTLGLSITINIPIVFISSRSLKKAL